ncbi:MAG: radical SAM protein [bacterium]
MNVVPIKSIIKSLLIINLRLTPKRIANMIKIFTSMLFSRLTRRQIVWGYPLFLMVEPTNICNLKCPMCPSGNGEMSRALGKLNFENYKRLLDDVGDRVLQVQLWNQGEPLINKSLLDFVRYAKGKGIVTQTSTNGHYIRTEEAAEEIVLSGLDFLIFSMDGTNQETYEKYRVGGNYQLVLDTLERIGRAKKRLVSKTPLVELQFIVFKHNQQEMDDLIQIAGQFDVNRISFKTAQVYSNDQANVFLPERDDHKRYDYDGQNYEMKGEIKNWCKRLWLNSTVNWNGSVSPCCFDKDAEHAFANVFTNQSSFPETWKNEKSMAFRSQVMKDRRSIEMCNNCTEGLEEPYITIVELGSSKTHT